MTCDAQLDEPLGLATWSAPGRRCWRRRTRRPAARRVIMLLTALPPAPPTPKTVIRGLSSVMSGILQIDRHGISSSCLSWPSSPAAAARCRRRCPAALRRQKLSLNHCPRGRSSRPCRSCARRGSSAPARAVRCSRDLRIDQQADRRREGRALGRFRQAGDAERPADAHVARRVSGAPPPAGRSSWLAPPVSTTRLPTSAGEAGPVQPVAHQLQVSSMRGADDARQRRARHLVAARRARRRRSAGR